MKEWRKTEVIKEFDYYDLSFPPSSKNTKTLTLSYKKK